MSTKPERTKQEVLDALQFLQTPSKEPLSVYSQGYDAGWMHALAMALDLIESLDRP